MDKLGVRAAPALAICLANAAVHGGVAAEVAALLNGATPGHNKTENLATFATAQPAVPQPKESPWDGENKGPVFSGHTASNEEAPCDTESSKWLKMVRERRLKRQRKPQPER